MVLPVPLYQLRCGTNSYDWGKIGSDSAAAILGAATTDLKIDEEKPYAELWMGTHPSLPSTDMETGRTLKDLISSNEFLLAPAVVSRFGIGKLPFLFKVLSIRKALSIQAHPDKRLAERLHADDPKNYPDDNHKPEMTIAITPFTGFCGFRPLAEIKAFLDNVLSLASLLGPEAINVFQDGFSSQSHGKQKEGLKILFEKLMTTSAEDTKSYAGQLLKSAQSDGAKFAGGEENAGGEKLGKLLIALNEDFPDDIGLFCTFFLNYVELKPGEGMFLRANDPHAYLSGDVIECMAASDNVVRAGFTPKFKDVKTLTNMLTYHSGPPAEQKMKPKPFPFIKVTEDTVSESLLYDPPIEEFSVIRTTLDRGAVQFTGIFGPSIILFTQGHGFVRGGGGGKKEIKVIPGTVVFLGAGVLVEMEGQDMVFFRAFCSVDEGQDSML